MGRIQIYEVLEKQISEYIMDIAQIQHPVEKHHNYTDLMTIGGCII